MQDRKKRPKRIKGADVLTIFNNLTTISDLSSKLENEIKRELPDDLLPRARQGKITMMDMDNVCWAVADLLLKYTPFLLLYAMYTNNYRAAVNTLSRLRKTASID